jgi:putative membrane protein
MNGMEKILVVCVDRDDDLGRKARVVGPVIGRKENLKAATKLALKDPGDTDVNCVFAAVRKFDEVAKKHQAELVTLTGHGKFGFESDKKIN